MFLFSGHIIFCVTIQFHSVKYHIFSCRLFSVVYVWYIMTYVQSFRYQRHITLCQNLLPPHVKISGSAIAPVTCCHISFNCSGPVFVSVLMSFSCHSSNMDYIHICVHMTCVGQAVRHWETKLSVPGWFVVPALVISRWHTPMNTHIPKHTKPQALSQSWEASSN